MTTKNPAWVTIRYHKQYRTLTYDEFISKCEKLLSKIAAARLLERLEPEITPYDRAFLDEYLRRKNLV